KTPEQRPPVANVTQTSPQNKPFTLTDVELEEYVRYLRCRDAGLTSHIEAGSGPRATIEVGGTKLSVLVDSGSPINIMDSNAFDKLANKPNLDPCKSEYHAFMSTNKLPIRGRFVTTIWYQDRSTEAVYFVVYGSSTQESQSTTSENKRPNRLTNRPHPPHNNTPS
ncbi:hypothetical protein BpHYR1_035282, partial [Brachionus plicatilis]